MIFCDTFTMRCELCQVFAVAPGDLARATGGTVGDVTEEPPPDGAR